MVTATMEPKLASGRGHLVPAASLAHLVAGTLVTTDLRRVRDFYMRFFGLECAVYAPDRMLVRDRRSKYLMARGDREFFVLDVKQVPVIERPQGFANHWGFSVGSKAEVDRVRAEAVKLSEELGIKLVHSARNMHGSYGFYMVDVDENWWEVECRDAMTHDLLFSRGDFNAEGKDSFPVLNPSLDIASTAPAVIGDEGFFTHGTTAVADCAGHREFYEKVLRLRTVQHSNVSNLSAGAGDFGFVGVKSGDQIQDQLPENRFVLLVDTDDELESCHREVLDSSDRYGLKAVTAITEGAFGGRCFLLRTRDQIWFEISSRSPESYRQVFAAN